MINKNIELECNDHFLCFTLAGEECGIPMPWVKKLVLYKDWSSFESTPQYQDGVLLHNNLQIPLLDLLRFLGVGKRRNGSLASVIIVKIKGDIYGVIVDGINDAVYFETDKIDFETPLVSDFNTDYIYGIAQHGKSKAVLLRLDSIIAKALSKNEESTLAKVI